MRYSSLALLVACSVISGMTQAATTITFEGKITDQTCSVSVDGKQGNTVTVSLPTLHTEAFSTSQTAGTTPFDIAITGCDPASDKDEKYTLTFKATNPTSGGYLPNTPGNGQAENVAVQLTKDAAGSDALNLSNPALIELTLPANTTTTSHTMAAQYIRIDKDEAITPGKVLATVEYELDYL